MKNFKTYGLAKELYRACQGLRKPNRHLRDQLDRASLSIVLNVAEGYGRRTQSDRRRHYYIALGSLREVQAILDLIEAKPETNQADKLGAHLYKLIQNPAVPDARALLAPCPIQNEKQLRRCWNYALRTPAD